MTIQLQDQEKDNEKPPSCLPRPAHPWRVAVLANIKEHDKPLPPDVPPDAGADYDYIETIDYIRAAIETDGHQAFFIQADANLPAALKEVKPRITILTCRTGVEDVRGII